MSATVQPPAELTELERHAAQLDAAQAQIPGLDPLPRKVVRDNLEALNAIHATALRQIVRVLREDPHAKQLLFELVDDPAVHMVLAMHGIIRTSDPRAEAERALDSIRGGIRGHGGDVELVLPGAADRVRAARLGRVRAVATKGEVRGGDA